MKIINFDHNASTDLALQALAQMNEAYKITANSSSVHSLGRKTAMMIEAVRDDLRKALNAFNYEVYFTSGGTESNNMVLFGGDFAKIFRAKIEHSSVYEVNPQSVDIIDFSTNSNGVINLDDLQNKLEKSLEISEENSVKISDISAKNSSKNFLVSVMLANNETGAIQPVKEAAKIVHQKGGLIHSDLVQAFGKIAIDLENLNVDFATVSAHKMGGPQGVGAVLVRKGLDIQPMFFGGGHEKGKRAGTLNNAGIAGFGAAIKLLPQRILQIDDLHKTRDFIESELKKFLGDKICFFSQDTLRLANTSLFAIRNIDPQTFLINCDLNGIAVSSGSACSSGTVGQSRVLKAMNINKEFLGGIRISLGLENTKLEAEKFIAVACKSLINIIQN